MEVKSYVGWWLHTLDKDKGEIVFQGQIVAESAVDYTVEIYGWVMGELTGTIKIAKTAVIPSMARLYSNDRDMREAYRKQEKIVDAA